MLYRRVSYIHHYTETINHYITIHHRVSLYREHTEEHLWTETPWTEPVEVIEKNFKFILK